jgi:hypothetical protein
MITINTIDICKRAGHDLVMIGGRPCPEDYSGCSQTVYQCTRCGAYDYGEPGGQGWKDCEDCMELFEDGTRVKGKQ